MSNVDAVLPQQAGYTGLVIAGIGLLLGLSLLLTGTVLRGRLRAAFGIMLMILGLGGVLICQHTTSSTRSARTVALQHAIEQQLHVTVPATASPALQQALDETTHTTLTVASQPTDCVLAPAGRSGDHYALLVTCGDTLLAHYSN